MLNSPDIYPFCLICHVNVDQYIKDQVGFLKKHHGGLATLAESLLSTGCAFNNCVVLHLLGSSLQSRAESTCSACQLRMKKHEKHILFLYRSMRKPLTPIQQKVRFLPSQYSRQKWILAEILPLDFLGRILQLNLGFTPCVAQTFLAYLTHLGCVFGNSFVSSHFPSYIFLLNSRKVCRICLAIYDAESLNHFLRHLAHAHEILPPARVRETFNLRSKKNYKWWDTFKLEPALRQKRPLSREYSLKYALRKRKYYYSRQVEEPEYKTPRILRSVKARAHHGYYKEYYTNDQSGVSDYSESGESFSSSVSFESDEFPELEEEIQINPKLFEPLSLQSTYTCQFCSAKFETLREKMNHWPTHLGGTEGGFDVPSETKSILVEDIESYHSMSLMDCKKDLTLEHLESHQLPVADDTSSSVRSSVPEKDEESSEKSGARNRHGSASSTRTGASIDSGATHRTRDSTEDLASYTSPEHPLSPRQYWKHINRLKSTKTLKSMCNKKTLRHFYKCLHRSCDFSTDDPHLFYRHSQTHPEEHHLPCVYCFKEYAPYQLMVHMTLEHGCRTYQCNVCFYRAGLRDLVENHHSIHHINCSFAILHCPTDYRISILRHVFSLDNRQSLIPRAQARVALQRLILPPGHLTFFFCEECNSFMPLERKIRHYNKYHPSKKIATTPEREELPTEKLLEPMDWDSPTPFPPTSTPISLPQTPESRPVAPKQVKSKYRCKYCSFEGETGVIVRKHCKLKHPNRPVMFKCPQAGRKPRPSPVKAPPTPLKEVKEKPVEPTCQSESSSPMAESPGHTSPTPASDSKHSPISNKKQCYYCDEEFTMSPYLYRHWKETHQHWTSKFRMRDEEISNSSEAAMLPPPQLSPPKPRGADKLKRCNYCSEGFPTYSAKYKHMRMVHKVEPPFRMANPPKTPPTLTTSPQEAEPTPYPGKAPPTDYSKLTIRLPNVYKVRIPFSSFTEAINISPKLLLTDAKNLWPRQ